MSKLNRSLLWSGLVVAAVAACGDDVTVTPPPPPPPPTCSNVSVAPNGITLTHPATQQMTAAVVCDAGVATAVTWSAAPASVATIDATGKLTTVGSGSVAVQACVTAVPSVCGVATVNVAGAVPATISIQSITAGGTIFPVNINNVVGQIDVSLNFEPGTTPAQRVELLIDGVVVASQSFSALQWARLVEEAEEAAVKAGDELTKVVIVLSVNTADFNTTTGVPKFLNGPRQLSARAVLQGGTQVATPSTTLIFNNANTFTGTMTVTAPATSAAGSVGAAAGLTYRRGGLSFTVLPVIYSSGISMASGNIVFGGCSAGGARTATLTAPAAGSSAWTATMSNTAAAGATNVTAYQFDQAICAAATIAAGETFIVNAVDTQGNTLFAGTPPSALPPATPVAGIRLDNVGPGAPTFVANPNNRQNGWINAAVGLTGLNTSATDNDWMLNGAADIGVGGYTRVLRVGTGGGTVANANAATGSATPALPAPSATNLGYCGVASATDALGNESGLPANATACLSPPFASFTATGTSHLQFGVDIAAPTIAFSGGLAANARINAATVGGEFQVTVADTGALGNSGMLGGAPVIGNVQTRSAAATVCGGGGMPGAVVGGVCTNNNTGIAGALPLQATTGVADETTAAYYTGTFLSQDAAGNQSATVTRVVVRDNSPVVVSSPAIPVTITGAFTASAFLNDDLSIRDYYWTAGFTTALIAPTTITLASAPTVVDAFNSATLTNTNFAINTSINTFLGLQATVGGVPSAYAAGSNPLSAVNLFARDQTQPAYSTAGSPVAPTAPATGIAVTNAAPAWTFNTYTAATTNATVCAGQAGAPACGATPSSTVISAAASGTTATFPNPFSRVDFYAVNAAGSDLVLIGSVAAGSATLVDNGATRVWTYSLSITALQLYTTLGGTVPAVIGPVNVYAFGVNAAGNVALVSGAVAQTINP